MAESKTILLTGATGFLGSNLLKGMLSAGWNVVILKRSSSDIKRIIGEMHQITSYDIDSISLDSVFEAEPINRIVHCAVEYGRDPKSNLSILDVNLRFSVELLECAKKYGVVQFINTDSFFNQSNLNYTYLSGYSLSKKQLIEWLKLYSEEFQIVNLRLGHIFGLNDGESKFISWFVKQLIEPESEESIKLTPGEQLRDFVSVSDVVEAYLFVLNNYVESDGYSSFDVGTGRLITLKEFVIDIKSCISDLGLMKFDRLLEFGALPYRNGEIMSPEMDCKPMSLIGWKSLSETKDAIRVMIENNNLRRIK